MTESLLANGTSGSNAADRHRVVVHVDELALKSNACGGSAEPPASVRQHDRADRDALNQKPEQPIAQVPISQIQDGPTIARETAQRLACDASVIEISCRGEEPLSVGRARRTVPPAIRRALRSRDKRCRYPGCSNHLFVDAHHIRHWADGGETSLDNLVLLCRRHHRLLHEGAFKLLRTDATAAPSGTTPNCAEAIPVRDEGEFRFARPNGVVIEPAPMAPRSHPGAVAESNRAKGLDPGAQALNARYRGQRLDLHRTIGGLCDREDRSRRAQGP